MAKKKGSRSNNAEDNGNDIYKESLPDISGIVRRKFSKACSVKGLQRKLPITEWLPKYQSSFLIQDFVAGLSVGLTAIPQGIAYAVVAGLPPQYGLYSSFMGCFVYAVFGSCKDVTIGPTAIMALMIHSSVVDLNINFAILGTFLSGCVIFMMGLLNLGFLVQFISLPTITGFISAATIIIGSGQVKPLLGIKSGSSSEFIDAWVNVFKHYDEIRVSDTILGVSCLILLILMKNSTKLTKCKKFFKYLSISRNAIVVILGIVIAYIFHANGSDPFRLTGEIKEGLPSLEPPPFSTTFNGEKYNFGQMVKALGMSLITIPLVSILESISIAKAFSKGKIIDATQEMLALGLCNIASSFAQSIPITGSFTRTAVNNASGVKTQLGGCFTGALVLLALGLLTKTFFFIPKTVLAAVIIAAMISMFETHEVKEIYRTKKSDIVPFLATFIFSLWLGLEYGILLGIGLNLFFTIYNSSRPTILFEIVKAGDTEVMLVRPDQSLNYSSAEYFKSCIIKKSTVEYPDVKLIVVDGSAISSIDSTVSKNVVSVINDLSLNIKKIIFWNWNLEVFNVMMRHSPQFSELFKHSVDLTDLLLKVRTEVALTDITTE